MREHDNKSKGKMKTIMKHLGIALVLITILSLTACVSNKKIILPKAEEVKEIEIMKNTSEDRLKIENQDEIFGIIADIEENTKDTAREVLTINLQILMIILSLNSITKMQIIVQALTIYIKEKTDQLDLFNRHCLANYRQGNINHVKWNYSTSFFVSKYAIEYDLSCFHKLNIGSRWMTFE